jgi:hypothetical protein
MTLYASLEFEHVTETANTMASIYNIKNNRNFTIMDVLYHDDGQRGRNL